MSLCNDVSQFNTICQNVSKYGQPGFEVMTFDENHRPVVQGESCCGLGSRIKRLFCYESELDENARTVWNLINFFVVNERYVNESHVPALNVAYRIDFRSPDLVNHRIKFSTIIRAKFKKLEGEKLDQKLGKRIAACKEDFVKEIFKYCVDETRFIDTTVPAYNTKPLLGDRIYQEFPLEHDELEAFCDFGRMRWMITDGTIRPDVMKVLNSNRFLYQPLLNLHFRLDQKLKDFPNGAFLKSPGASPQDAVFDKFKKLEAEEIVWKKYMEMYEKSAENSQSLQELNDNQFPISEMIDVLDSLKGTMDDIFEFFNSSEQKRTEMHRFCDTVQRELGFSTCLDGLETSMRRTFDLPKRGYKRKMIEIADERNRAQDRLVFINTLNEIAKEDNIKALNAYIIGIRNAVMKFNSVGFTDTVEFSRGLQDILDAINDEDVENEVDTEDLQKMKNYFDFLRLSPQRIEAALVASKWFQEHPAEGALLGVIEREVAQLCRPKPLKTADEVFQLMLNSFRIYVDAESCARNQMPFKWFIADFHEGFDRHFKMTTNSNGLSIALTGVMNRRIRAYSVILPPTHPASCSLESAANRFSSTVTRVNDPDIGRDLTMLDNAIPGRFAREYVSKKFSLVIAKEINEFIKLDVIIDLGIKFNYFGSLTEWEIKFIETNTGYWARDNELGQTTEPHFFLWHQLHARDKEDNPKTVVRISNICLGGIMAASKEMQGETVTIEDCRKEFPSKPSSATIEVLDDNASNDDSKAVVVHDNRLAQGL